MDPATFDAIKKAVQEAFSAEGGDKRFIDVSRVPLICQAIVTMGSDIGEIKKSIKENGVKLDTNFVSKTEFTPVKTLVYGFVGLILIAVVGAIVGLVITKP